jgi:glycosyltransferase involved in cell wall biosynthesis
MGRPAKRRALPLATGDGKIRVLLLIKCLGQGGAERILVDVAAVADRDGFSYEAAYVLKSEDGLVPEMRATGTPVHSLGSRGNWDLSWLRTLRRVLVSGRYDVVHAHLPYAASLGRLVVMSLPADRRPRFVYTEHSIWGKAAGPVRWLNRVAATHDDALVAVSDSVREALPEVLRSRAQVVVHGVDLSQSKALAERRTEVRDEVRRELDIPESDALVLTVANLRPEKGYDILLRAVRIMLDRDLPATFVSVGRGPLKEQLSSMHRAMRLGDKFKFLGPRDDVQRLMAACDVFVLPSRQEGLPVTLMEATSAGAAIVATAVGEVPRILTSGIDGLVVAPDDADSLADAVEKLVRDPVIRAEFGANAKKLSAQFDVSRATRKLEEIYRELAGSKSPV